MTADTVPNMRDLAAAVAAQMPGWGLGETSQDRPDPFNGWARIKHTSGAELSLSHKTHPKACIHISGVWPQRGQLGEFMPRETAPYSINVALTKSPAQIARDIARRVETAYLAEFAIQAGHMRAAIEGADTARATAARIAAAVGEPAREASGHDHTIWLTHFFDNRRGHGDIVVSPGGTGEPAYVKMELRGITPDEAIRILAVLHGGLQGEAVLATTLTATPIKENPRA